ncbi:UDP-N-acetylglucosamine 1-carboxyvinyltransferase [Anaeromicrobium sediminis]|uniref:UDP-N-acetylglucosamine 1-carboxyvinyltransferase n=1 Tax=Anaeromicrobium sediminis TaxID=1478221 RepID=A0A267MJ57_9FIRM|nr:UDP-N-acetylglucosamine 1-carboxyvinyltransferase [Anaeromicrobium sediminis]PAB58830.1 UDP-N-acetylglucosamine 1-carboxyvinyltransferase [Anaeromicrobium sediminis]
MSRLLVKGQNKLNGELAIKGAKNAVLPILAATILNKGESILFDAPHLSDVDAMINILQSIGCKIEFENSIMKVDTSNLSSHEIPEHLVREMRSSIFLMGPMLARCGKIKISYPGGCEIGPRPIDLHLKALRQLGVKIKEAHGFLECEVVKLDGTEIHLDYPSVGATENTMLLAVMANGTTKIRNAAKEPEIVELQTYLNKMGAKVSGAGTSQITIEGVKKLNRVEHKIMADRIVAGTMLVAGAMAGGDIILKNIVIDHIKPIISKLRESGCIIEEKTDSLRLKTHKRIKAIEMTKTLPYPGFPTDMQAQFMSLMAIAKGTSIITETVFENRFKHVDELMRMGANIKIDGRVAVIQGVPELTGANVTAKDLRGGAALVLAGLGAEGITIVNNVKHIDRGYDRIEEMLKCLGAEVYRLN